MTTINNATTTELINKVAEWAEMTDNNEHSEVLCDVALFFELDEYVDYFFPFVMKDGLTLGECNSRHQMAIEMRGEIYQKYGKSVANIIAKAF